MNGCIELNGFYNIKYQMLIKCLNCFIFLNSECILNHCIYRLFG